MPAHRGRSTRDTLARGNLNLPRAELKWCWHGAKTLLKRAETLLKRAKTLLKHAKTWLKRAATVWSALSLLSHCFMCHVSVCCVMSVVFLPWQQIVGRSCCVGLQPLSCRISPLRGLLWMLSAIGLPPIIQTLPHAYTHRHRLSNVTLSPWKRSRNQSSFHVRRDRDVGGV